MLKKIAITMGDPAGIGAEVVVKSLMREDARDRFIPVVIGDKGVFKLNCARFGCNVDFIEIGEDELDRLKPLEHGQVHLISTDQTIDITTFKFGIVNAGYGRAAGSYIEKAARLVLDKKLDALVTAPINKQAFNLGGYDFQGHTDLLAHLTGSKKEVMMLTGGRLAVILCTVHVSLKHAIEMLTAETIVKTVQVAHNDFRRYFNRPAPKFAVAALNPHASEGGHFGSEEADIIIPAVNELRAMGIDITGPMASDSLFYHAKNGAYDAVICMYHDQGLIPLKVLHFDTGINVTLGLNIIRTSVDHGTAFEIAGKGVASETSMLNAIDTAIKMCENKKL